MSQKSNFLDDILNENENTSDDSKNQNKKHTANEKLNQNSKSNSNKNNSNIKKSNKNIKHNNHKRTVISKSKPNADNKYSNSKPNLPWSCTLGLNNIAKLDSLEMIYHLKNRNDALSLVLNKSLNSLIKAKGHKGMQEYNLNAFG